MFSLGGLAGVPFTGKTGWGAFSGHVPENGNILVLYAPHVGIDAAGNIGKFKRHHQHAPSTACGATIGAYNALLNNDTSKDPLHDPQMDYLKEELKLRKKAFMGKGEGNERMA